MNGDKFSKQLETVNQRSQILQEQAKQTHWSQPELVADSLEKLRVALEALRVAEEELKAQNEGLVCVQEIVEAERQRYRELFELAPDGYLVTDEEGRIWEANCAAAQLLKVSQRFLTGESLVTFVPIQERRALRIKLLQLRQLCPIQEWELRLQPRDGDPFDAALSVAVVRDRGGLPISLRWLLRDVTVRKQAEEKLRQIELQNLQLIEAARLKSQFLAIMSHELRTPMNAIIGFSQVLLRQPHNQLTQLQANMVGRILNSGKNLLALIEDILDFSQLNAHRLELKLEPMNLADLVLRTTEELYPLATQKHLSLDINLALDNSQIVNDRARVRQILVNLLSNALKFTEIGRVSVDVWEVSPDRIAIAVRDTGIGIIETNLSQIFEEFRQVNQTISRQYNGMGLGLAITKSLVYLMKGTISVESKVGEGSIFRIELPRS